MRELFEVLDFVIKRYVLTHKQILPSKFVVDEPSAVRSSCYLLNVDVRTKLFVADCRPKLSVDDHNRDISTVRFFVTHESSFSAEECLIMSDVFSVADLMLLGIGDSEKSLDDVINIFLTAEWFLNRVLVQRGDEPIIKEML